MLVGPTYITEEHNIMCPCDFISAGILVAIMSPDLNYLLIWLYG